MRRKLAPAPVALVLALTACAAGGDADQGEDAAPSPEAEESQPTSVGEVSTELTDPEGSVVGAATFTDTRSGIEVRVEVNGLPPGFHGVHLHEVGLCEADSPDPADPSRTGDFLSAGPHLGSADAPHGRHAGDLPPLLVIESGVGAGSTLVAVPKVEDLLDGDGTALVVDEAPDNLGHIPSRYAAEGPDDETRSGGDAGARIACGAIGR
jgi:Cu-Zn family superoxide dismutase